MTSLSFPPKADYTINCQSVVRCGTFPRTCSSGFGLGEYGLVNRSIRAEFSAKRHHAELSMRTKAETATVSGMSSKDEDQACVNVSLHSLVGISFGNDLTVQGSCCVRHGGFVA